MSSQHDSLSLHHALGRLLAEAGRDPRLQSEITRARREFFGVEAPVRGADEQAAAEVRFAEWVLLERSSDVLGDTPVRALGSVPDVLRDSVVGVFLVEGEPREVVRLRDLQSDDVLDLVPPDELPLGRGDLVVGRLFPDGRGGFVPSAAVAVQPGGGALAEAFRRDVAALSLERRLSQAELEHLLFRRWAEVQQAQTQHVPLERLEAELQAHLHAAGKMDFDVAEVSQALAESTHPGRVMGPLLDELAFDTDADLERLRWLLLAIWNAHRVERGGGAGGGAAAPAVREASEPAPMREPEVEGEGLGQRLARRIEDGLARHEDIEALFDDVAAMMGADPSELADEDDGPGGFDQGDLEPLVQEFLWEEGLGEGLDKTVLTELVRQQREAPVPKLDLEYLQADDLMRLLLQIYLQSPPAERAPAVQAAFDVLRRFYAWAERTQEYDLGEALAGCRHDFVGEVERLHHASLTLSGGAERGPTADARPTLLRVAFVEDDGIEVLPSHDGSDAVWVPDADAARVLRTGDLILGVLRRAASGEGRIEGMVLVLPAQAEALLG